MNFMFSWQTQYLTRSLRSLVRYCVYHSNIKFISSRHLYLCTQGVLKVRKRVTLMVVTVSAIFVICWGPDHIFHISEAFTSHKLSTIAIPIAHTMIMFNSAVNPFAYALINQKFREKMKGMICCSLRSSSVNVAREPQDFDMNNITAKPTDTAEPSATE